LQNIRHPSSGLVVDGVSGIKPGYAGILLMAEKEKTASCRSGFSKKEDLKCLCLGLDWVLQDVWIGFLRIWIFDSNIGFSSDWIGFFIRIGYIKSI
jgi:hypothetical protein